MVTTLYLFLPRDDSAERGDEIACRPSVCLSVCEDRSACLCEDHVPRSNTLEYLKAHVLVDAQRGRSDATGTPPKLGLNRVGVSST